MHGTPMLEDGFLVPKQEPPPQFHAYRSGSHLRLGPPWRAGTCASRWSNPRTVDDQINHPPTFSLTPR
jgi:hypothetical protein